MIGIQRLMTVQHLKFSVIVLLLSFLSGCASLMPQGTSKEFQQQLSKLNHWQARGKLSVISPDSSNTGYLTWKQDHQAYDLYIAGPLGKLSVISPDSSNTGYLTWKQDHQAYDLYIAGPFGAGASRLEGNQHQANLLLPGWKEPQHAASAEELMLIHTGWNFPVSQIRYWVKGQPIPKSKAKTQFNDSGLLETLEQHGWTIRYSRYKEQNGYWLPSLIRISGYDFRFTFAIKEWTLYD